MDPCFKILDFNKLNTLYIFFLMLVFFRELFHKKTFFNVGKKATIIDLHYFTDVFPLHRHLLWSGVQREAGFLQCCAVKVSRNLKICSVMNEGVYNSR